MSMIGRRYYIFGLLVAFICLMVGFVAGLLIGRKRGIPFVSQREDWSIGIYSGESPFDFSASRTRRNPVLTAEDVTDVPAKFVADPFLVREDSVWYLFFEVYNTNSKQGDIAVATSNNTRKWNYERVVLDEPFHLSYPYVFNWQNDYYLIPESHETNSVRLYKAVDFPSQWSFLGTLIEGRDFVDPSVVHFNDEWWMFVSSLAQGDTLRLYYADDLMGPWNEHPGNPIVRVHENMARPGGRVLEYDGRVFRYQQDLNPGSYHRLWPLEVTELTTTRYREELLSSHPMLEGSGSGWNEKGMHHIDPHQVEDNKWIASVDGYGTYLVFSLGF
jgi:hypothetical protein